jgi:hypothetical protein
MLDTPAPKSKNKKLPRLKENLMSQVRRFLEGSTNLVPNPALDNFVWLITKGFKTISIKGRPPEGLIVREKRASVSLEKFLLRHLEYFFRPDLTQIKKEELFIRFTNRMTHEDADIVYRATAGQIVISDELVAILERYAGDRRFAGGDYVFRREWVRADLKLSDIKIGDDGLYSDAEIARLVDENERNDAISFNANVVADRARKDADAANAEAARLANEAAEKRAAKNAEQQSGASESEKPADDGSEKEAAESSEQSGEGDDPLSSIGGDGEEAAEDSSSGEDATPPAEPVVEEKKPRRRRRKSEPTEASE